MLGNEITVADASQNVHQVMAQQLHAILANASIGIMITRKGRFELAGRHLCQMFGYSESELLALPTYSIYRSREAYVDIGHRMRADLTEHGHFDGELLMRRKNGSEIWVHMQGRAVIPGDHGGGTIWILEDISLAREARDKLSWTATHDSLTGLVNRKEFEVRLDLAMSQFRRLQFCVMFIDLDKFKAVNDGAGHAAGDEVLRNTAALIEATLRQSDTVARLGGDEFAILLPGCPLARGRDIAEQVRLAVLGYSLTVDGKSYSVGTSIGLVEVTPRFANVAAVIHAADTACYSAKRSGRNRVVSCVPVDDEVLALTA
jgi:diguanylate cyclase